MLLLAIVMAITWGLGAAQEQAAAVDTEKKVFVATKDWQPIPEGYSIPQVRKEGILSPLSLRPLLLEMHMLIYTSRAHSLEAENEEIHVLKLQGLHVRMDLGTGGKFAKLLDRDEPPAGNALTISQNATAKKPVPEGMDEEVEPERVEASKHDAVDASLRTIERVLHNLPQGERTKMGIDLEKVPHTQ
jgi:hypothetical protein